MAQPKKIKHNCRILICIIIIFYQIPTGCSLTEALIDKRLLVELRVQYVQIVWNFKAINLIGPRQSRVDLTY